MPTETCQNCGSVIGAMEQAFVHAEKIVCGDCKRRLDPRYRPAATPVQAGAAVPLPVQVVTPPQPRRQPLCPQCGIPMKKKTQWSGSFVGEIFGLILFLVGVVLCVFIITIPVGLILIALGLLCSARKRRKIWRCRSCRQVLERG